MLLAHAGEATPRQDICGSPPQDDLHGPRDHFRRAPSTAPASKVPAGAIDEASVEAFGPLPLDRAVFSIFKGTLVVCQLTSLFGRYVSPDLVGSALVQLDAVTVFNEEQGAARPISEPWEIGICLNTGGTAGRNMGSDLRLVTRRWRTDAPPGGARYEEALERYRAGGWDAAEAAFADVVVESFREWPTTDAWNGVHDMLTK